ncbi:OLC1v1004675C1 [Oldenlandia corymbosa var. corymbosa]|uniref:RING-type E3 ubiquitin transferase n=1 Tax=Oldenlandia corymbosa var. corymbosa TaxID=529605 RepID=A0AAV1DFU6_OLDCO|nr:OLC1v1004675C1 [Oldenlandia corymbosa var. corymbosa]
MDIVLLGYLALAITASLCSFVFLRREIRNRMRDETSHIVAINSAHSPGRQVIIIDTSPESPAAVAAPSKDVIIDILGYSHGGHSECSICLSNNYEDGDEESSRRRSSSSSAPCMWSDIPGCGHRFHSGCIAIWLAFHQTCPLCRKMVPLPM